MPTYKQFKKFLRDKCWNERDYGEGIYDKLIYDFLVEEVKENKQTLTFPEMEYKGEREYYRNGIKLKKLKESPSYDEMVSMGMPTELTGCQGVITEHNIGSMGYHQDVENTILRNQEDWKREHGFLSEEDRPEHPKGYLYPETINSYYDTNKTKEWNYQEYQKQLKKAQDEWWAGVKENKEPQFTPGQEIEVSDDGDKWYTSVFKKKEFDGFGCKNDGVWLFARPIEDKIEPLPEFDSNHIEGECVYQDRSVRQISLLTIAVNKLIAKQN